MKLFPRAPILILSLGCPAFAQEPAEADPLYGEIRAAAEELLVEHATPGLAVARLVDGELAWSQGIGYADAETRAPVTPRTVFNVGSVSKVVAAWGVMRLVERGEVELDRPVWTWVTRWRLPESPYPADGVTVRRLLSHTAGLSLHGYPGFEVGAVLPTLEESLSGATGGRGGVELVHEPGSRWSYSGGGYTLLQLMVEEVTERPFADSMKEAVLDPLGMASSDYRWTEAILERAATPHDEEGRPFAGQRFTALAAAGLQTTVLDLARFGEATLAVDRAGTGGVLAPETIREMLEPIAPGAPVGLGYRLMGYYGLDTVGHSGSNDGWEAMFAVEPRTRDGIVLLSNGSNGEQVLRALHARWTAVVQANVAALEAREAEGADR